MPVIWAQEPPLGPSHPSPTPLSPGSSGSFILILTGHVSITSHILPAAIINMSLSHTQTHHINPSTVSIYFPLGRFQRLTPHTQEKKLNPSKKKQFPNIFLKVCTIHLTDECKHRSLTQLLQDPRYVAAPTKS